MTTTSKTKEILSAQDALEGLLVSQLMPSPSLHDYLDSIPSEEELEAATTTQIEDIINDILGFLSSAAQFLQGTMTDVDLDKMPLATASHLEALLLASLAFDLPSDTVTENVALLALCQKSIANAD